MHGRLLALAVGAGLEVMEAEVCGPRGKHDPGPDRDPARHGRWMVTRGGRRVPGRRPRIRAVYGAGEPQVSAFELTTLFSLESGWSSCRL
jgi:hypothetical protein